MMRPTSSGIHGCRNNNSWQAVRASTVSQPGPHPRQQASSLASSTAIAAASDDAEDHQQQSRQVQQPDADQGASQPHQRQPQPLPLSTPPPPQQRQQPRIVLTPLSNPAAAPGSILKSSALGTWSAVGPYVPAAAPAQGRPRPLGPSGRRQQMQRRSGHKGWKQHSEQPGGPSSQEWLQSKGRQMTTYISSASNIRNLLDMVKSCQASEAFNTTHIATAYKALADLCLKRAKPQQRRQQQQQLHAVAEPVDEVLLLLDGLAASHLASAAAAVNLSASAGTSAQPGGTDSSWHGSSAGLLQPPAVPLQPPEDLIVRSLSTIINHAARLEHKLPWATLLLLLDEFLQKAGAQQQAALQHPPLHAGQRNDSLPPQQQQQQQRLQPQPEQGQLWQSAQSGSSSTSSASGSQDCQRATCHAVSLLCWGLSKLGFTTFNVYELSSDGSEEAQQQRLRQQRQYWQRLASLAAQVVRHGSSRDVSTLCYAFAAGGYKDVALWGRLGPQVVSGLNSFTPQEFSQTLWAFAVAGAAYRPLLLQAGSVAQHLAPGFTPQGLANVLWAMVTLNGSVPPQLLAATEDACLRRDLDRFGSVNLTMLVCAHARTRSMRVELGAAINQAVVRSLPSFSCDNLCKLVAGLAVLGCLQQPLLEAAEPKLLKHLRAGTVDVQVACFGVWGVALTDPARALRLLPAMLQLAGRQAHLVARSSDATAKLCSALSMTRYRDDVFMDRLAHCLIGTAAPVSAAAPVPASTPPPEPAPGSSVADATAAAAAAAAAAATATATASVADTTAAAAAAAATATAAASLRCSVARWQHASAPQHMVTVAACLARLGFSQHTALLQLLMQQYLARVAPPDSYWANSSSSSSSSGAGSSSASVSAFHLQQVLVLLWAAAVLDMRELVQPLRSLLRLLHGAVDLPTASMAQLVQVHMWLQTHDPAGSAAAALIPQNLLEESLKVWRQQLVPAVVLSELHREVLGQLTAMKLQPVAEARTADGLFSVDIMVQFKGCAVAIEVLGPDHYTSNMVEQPPAVLRHQQSQQQQHMLLGPELLRFRLLAARGLALAAVSSFEAAGAVSTLAGAQALRQLLEHKLTEAVELHKQSQQQAQQQQQQQHQEAAALLTHARGDKQPAVGATRKGRQQLHQPGAQPMQPVSGAGDSQLSQLVLQPGFSEVQQKMRRTRAVHRQQRQQQREHMRTKQQRQEALQTLLSAAVARNGAASGGAAAGAGGSTATAVASDPFQAMTFDAEFDLPLDLDALAPPGQ